MLLAEVVIERDYIIGSINNLSGIIKSLLVGCVSDEKLNRERLNKLLERFEELYLKYQQYEVKIFRAQSLTTININKTEISLEDVIIMKDIMSNKLKHFNDFLWEIMKNRLGGAVCIDVSNIEEIVDTLKVDIKTLDIKIQNKMWSTEVR